MPLAPAAMLSSVSLPSMADPEHVALAFMSAQLHVPEQKRLGSVNELLVMSQPSGTSSAHAMRAPS